ncbi:hypothetical protein OROHE_015420 [Orobanche hederae]
MSDLTAKIRTQLQQEIDEKFDQKVREMMKKLAGQNQVFLSIYIIFRIIFGL